MTDNDKKENAIEDFLYIVAMSLLLIIFPVFQNMEVNMWINIAITLVLTFISYYLIKISTKYLKRKIFKFKPLPIYIIYFSFYFIIRITLEI